MKVLIVAPNASSRMGGEAFLPLKYFEILRQRGYTASLIAHSRNREELKESLEAYFQDIHFIEDSVFHRIAWRAGKVLPTALRAPLVGNLINQINEVYQKRLIRKLVDAGNVDIIHQPIPVSPRAPSRIYGFGVPVVIGPMNGNMSYPAGYEDYESRLSRWFIPAARALSVIANIAIPGKRRADILLVANDRTKTGLPVLRNKRIINLVENGVDLSIWSGGEITGPANAKPGALRLVFMGRIVDWKGLDFSLQAIDMARLQGNDVTLDILGDGPERSELERLSKALGIDSHVRFLGFKTQVECAKILQTSDALLLNSLRECGGAVVLEAMSMGLPVITSDWGGPADYVDPTCGILVSPAPRRDFSQRLSHAILDLANSIEKRQSMGEAGIRKIKSQFDWHKKIDRILEIYEEALSGKQ